MTAVYKAAVSSLPGWGDTEIMECDLGRLQMAIDASIDARDEQNRYLAHLAGFEVKKPESSVDDDDEDLTPQSPEELDARFVEARGLLGGRVVTAEELAEAMASNPRVE